MAMQIDILTPEKSLYSGKVIAVQFPGVEGSFQILTDHAPLVAALVAGQIVIETANGSESIDIPGGVVEVSNNILSVLAQ